MTKCLEVFLYAKNHIKFVYDVIGNWNTRTSACVSISCGIYETRSIFSTKARGYISYNSFKNVQSKFISDLGGKNKLGSMVSHMENTSFYTA